MQRYSHERGIKFIFSPLSHLSLYSSLYFSLLISPLSPSSCVRQCSVTYCGAMDTIEGVNSLSLHLLTPFSLLSPSPFSVFLSLLSLLLFLSPYHSLQNCTSSQFIIVGKN